MKKILLIVTLGVFFSGCAVTSVKYDSDTSELNYQYIEHSECKYLVGPFNTADDLIIENVIANTIKKGNEQGMYGNTLINVDIKEGGFTGIIFNKLCLYVKGNIVFTKDY
jgi:hypothetical protein